MTQMIARRILVSLLVLWAIVSASFFLVRLAPGGPFDSERQLAPATRTQLLQKYGLDRPLFEQYLRYLSGLAHLDFGPSLKYPDKAVGEILAEGLPYSMLTGGLALVVAILAGFGCAAFSATGRHPLANRLLNGAALVGISLPSMIIAPLLILVVSLWLGLLPAGLWDGPEHVVLPVLSLALPLGARIFMLAREKMLASVATGWFQAALARGIGRRQLLAHLLKNTLAPLAAFIAPATAALLTGSIVIETIFVLPGIGRHFVQAAFNRDFTLIIGVVIVYSTLLILLNLLADILLLILDPRGRTIREVR